MTSYTVGGRKIAIERPVVERNLTYYRSEVARLESGRYTREELDECTPAERWDYTLSARSEVERFAAILRCLDDGVTDLPESLYPPGGDGNRGSL